MELIFKTIIQKKIIANNRRQEVHVKKGYEGSGKIDSDTQF